MDNIDKKILDLLKGNARMSYQELGEKLGMSRVAAKKRVSRLEQAGIIRGYNTCIYRVDEVTLFIVLVIKPEAFDRVLEYVSTRTAFVRQIFTTTKANHIHMVAVSDSVNDLKYLTDLSELDLSPRSSNCLKRAGLDTVGKLVDRINGSEDLKGIRNCGAKSIREIMEHLFLFQYYSLKPERRDNYLAEVVVMNAMGRGQAETE